MEKLYGEFVRCIIKEINTAKLSNLQYGGTFRASYLLIYKGSGQNLCLEPSQEDGMFRVCQRIMKIRSTTIQCTLLQGILIW